MIFNGWLQAALKPLAAPLFISAALHSLVCSAEGALLVRRDLGFLSKLYAASAVLMPAALIALKRRGASLEAIWAYFCIILGESDIKTDI